MDSALAFAEAALARGDYSQCLNALEKLLEDHPLNTPKGSKIRLLMITALMGEGDDQQAISICRQLIRCKDNDIRQISKQLLPVLESPSLERPANWSIKLPSLDINPLTGSNSYKGGRKITKARTSPKPPTGPTKGMRSGFLILVLTILSGLTILLSGCIQIKTEINLPDPDRIKLSWQIESESNKILPWQMKFEDSLTKLISDIDVFTTPEGSQTFTAKALKPEEANLILQQTFSTAAKAAGFDIPPPILSLQEKNWLIGVHQNLKLMVNLENLQEIPGLKLLIVINNPDNENFISKPLLTKMEEGKVHWQIKSGRINTLEFEQWCWSRIGIGTILIIILLGLSLALQKIRLKMGFGFPELPP